MGDPKLSRHEQEVLRQIETSLEQDSKFTEALASASRSHQSRARKLVRHSGWGLCVLFTASTVVLIAAATTSSTPLIIAFSAVWTLTLAASLILLCAWSRHKMRCSGSPN